MVPLRQQMNNFFTLREIDAVNQMTKEFKSNESKKPNFLFYSLIQLDGSQPSVEDEPDFYEQAGVPAWI